MSKEYRYILGIQSFSNMDSGASIVRCSTDGELIDYIAISEERLIRVKYPYVFPVHSLGYCLDHYGIRLSDVDLLMGDYIRVKRWFSSGPAYNVSDFDYLKLKLDFPPHKIYQISHHMAHAASTYYASKFDEAAILIVDGNGSDLETTSYFRGEGERIEFMENYKRHGIGAAYTTISTRILSFGTGGEGKTMGLAPYGEGHSKVLNINAKLDGIKNDFSEFMLRMPYSDVLNQIDPRNRINPLRGEYKKCERKEDLLNPYFSRAAYDIQAETERILIHLASDLHEKTKLKNLCIAGGVGLNSVANKKILDNASFENIFIFPACSDSGIPFGLAVWGYYNMTKELGIKETKRFAFNNAYTGNEYPEDEIEGVFKKYNIPYQRVELDAVAEKIAEGKIVGWFQGRSEYGPRALGHRSILADSRRKEMKDVLNLRVKHRESFRPFAPSILKEYCSEYFDLDCDSPYMLLIAKVKKPDAVPSITHVDQTARIHTVTKDDNGSYYDLIEAFHKRTGVPCILNTSFNVAGEPIVETPEDAILCVLQTDMDYLAIGPFLMESSAVTNREKIVETMNANRKKKIETRREKLLKKYFSGYDPEERDRFIAESNKMAEWYVRFRAKFELEKKVLEWMKNQSKILVVGTPDHTLALRKYINGFSEIDVVGFCSFEDKVDKTPETLSEYPVVEWNDIKNTKCDEILISSYLHSFDIEERLTDLNPEVSVLALYDSSSRSIMDTLDTFPTYKV